MTLTECGVGVTFDLSLYHTTTFEYILYKPALEVLQPFVSSFCCKYQKYSMLDKLILKYLADTFERVQHSNNIVFRSEAAYI